MAFTHKPFARLLNAAGAVGFENAFTYQDYLYELLADGSSERAVTEQQWEMICDLKGKREMRYASTGKAAMESIVRKAGKES